MQRTGFLLFLVATTVLAAPPAKRAWPPARLAETGLYASDGAVAKENRTFAPQYPLWSDGAEKRRWFRIPRGTTIDATDPDSWIFPVGTRFWKEFTFGGKKIETRYLEKRAPGQWLFATYAWSEDEREARLVSADGAPNHVEIAPGIRHDLPSHADCRACHEGQARDAVLGFGAIQLSPDRDPNAPHAEPPDPARVDLSTLLREHLLRGAPSSWRTAPPTIVASSPDARAALGYLHGNCWGCHNDRDPVASVGMSLRVSLQARTEAEQPAFRTAVGTPSKFQLPDLEPGQSYRIAPGHPERSALLFRMGSRHPVRQMPPVGTKLLDKTALTLLNRWVGGVESTEATKLPFPTTTR